MNYWLLTAKKAWSHPEWEDTVQRWNSWLHELKKDEEKTKAKEHQKLVSRVMASAEEKHKLLHQHKTDSLERRCASAGRGGKRCQA